jgi:hypothetical protein
LWAYISCVALVTSGAYRTGQPLWALRARCTLCAGFTLQAALTLQALGAYRALFAGVALRPLRASLTEHLPRHAIAADKILLRLTSTNRDDIHRARFKRAWQRVDAVNSHQS